MSLLRQQPYVRELATDASKVRLYVDDADMVLPQLIRLLDKADIGVGSITLAEPSLDDVFLRKTGRSLSDADTVADSADGTSPTQREAAG